MTIVLNDAVGAKLCITVIEYSLASSAMKYAFLQLLYCSAYPSVNMFNLCIILEKITFFNERFAAGNIQPTIVAIPVENARDDEDLFKIAILTKTAKQLRKDYV